jgi:hypothetical protein
LAEELIYRPLKIAKKGMGNQPCLSCQGLASVDEIGRPEILADMPEKGG